MAVADAGIQPLERPQIRAAAELIAAAFQNDPLITWALPGGSRRDVLATHVFTRNICYAWHYGRVETTLNTLGAAVWLRPGHEKMTVWGMIRCGMLATPVRLGWRGFRRLRLYNAAKTRLHDQVMSGPHWYLLILAVAPQAQGRGLGKSLLQPVFRLADRDKLPCYLETTQHSNLPIFEKLGFQTRQQAHVPEDGPHLWGMVRDPQPHADR
jgi:ribosomal protein S18 acetylase RimI-like enzyme